MANTRGNTTSGDAAVGTRAGRGAADGSHQRSKSRSRRARGAVVIGAPQERLEILKQAAIEAAKAGIRIDVIQMPQQYALILAIRGAYQCQNGHWFLANETVCPACHTELPEKHNP